MSPSDGFRRFEVKLVSVWNRSPARAVSHVRRRPIGVKWRESLREGKCVRGR
ncbi:MAG: hypothetical protein ACTS4T_01040 [Candidatus Hodgkinia cicadicola]